MHLSHKHKKVYADYFTSFFSRELSGTSQIWQYYHGPKVHWSGDLYEVPGSRRKETATPFYPLIGTYDAKDPDVLEYHILLAKLAGLDGFFCEHALPTGHDAEVAETMARLAKRFHFHVGIHWITINFTQRTPGLKTRKDVLRAAIRCLKRAYKHIYSVAGISHRHRPVVLFFVLQAEPYASNQIAQTHFSADEVAALKHACPEVTPYFLTFAYDQNFRSKLSEAIDGYYPWLIPGGSPIPPHLTYDTYSTSSEQQKHLRRFYRRAQAECLAGRTSLVWGGAWPGFDDHRGRAWGEDLARCIPREDGRTFRRTWQTALEAQVPAILIATWNDWVESSSLEPSVEYGYRDLENAQTQINAWKHTSLSQASLRWPIRLFHLRKRINRYRQLHFPKAQLVHLDQLADRIALALSRFHWIQARTHILKLEAFCTDHMDTRILTESVAYAWSPTASDSPLRVRGLNSAHEFNTLRISLSPRMASALKQRLVTGRLAFTYASKHQTWFQIVQRSNRCEKEIANFCKQSKKKWDRVELDALAMYVPKAGSADYGFLISVTTPKTKAVLREITLTLSLASRAPNAGTIRVGVKRPNER